MNINLDSIGVFGNMMDGFFLKGDTLLLNCTFGKHKYEHVMLKFYKSPLTKQFNYSNHKLIFEQPEKILNSKFTRFTKPLLFNGTIYIKDFWGVYNTVTGKNILQKVFPIENKQEAITSFSFQDENLLYTTSLNKDTVAVIKNFSYSLNIFNMKQNKLVKLNIPTTRKIVSATLYNQKLICIETDDKKYYISVSLVSGI